MSHGPVRRHAHQVLLVAALGALIVAAARQYASIARAPSALAFGLTLGYLAWLLAEVRVTFERRADPPADDNTLLPYAVARVATVVAAVFGPLPWTGWAAWMALPVAVFAGGIGLRLWAIRVLGRFYSHRVVRQRQHRIVTTGPYAWVRHPAYTAMIAANIGFVGFFANVFSVVGLVLLVAAIAWRIRTEERMLATIPEYRGYAAATPRLVPGVW
jgi:protein-S-isoprenylcysteine O-methyltransferase Ste14